MSVTERVDASEISDRVESRLEALGAPEDTAPDGPWRITGRGSADWVARHRGRAIAAVEAVRTDAASQRAVIMEAVSAYLFPIDQFEKEETERLEREIGHWEAKLAEWHRDVLREDKDAKTIKLPHAVLHSRKQPDKWEFTDEFLSWAESNLPFSLRTKIEVDKPSVKAELKSAERTDEGRLVGAQGEIIPGVTVLPGDTNFTIESGAEL